MDYNLESLGTRQFEHLTQALAVRVLGARVSVFGDGPDGGREAAWEGDTPSLGLQTRWRGYGILQAKMRQHPLSVGDNLKWLKRELTAELDRWAEGLVQRERRPEYFILATNVRLSAASGKDAIKKTLSELNEKHALGLKDFRVWDYDEIKALLDDAPGIRRTYAALITPGDVVATILSSMEKRSDDIAHALRHHAARSFRDDTHLNLTQAGTVRDQKVTVADVFVDLPFGYPGASSDGEEMDEMEAFPLHARRKSAEQIATHLITRFDAVALEGTLEAKKQEVQKKTVLIGGPGQGKSTVTQFLAQVYRTEFLAGTAIAEDAELRVEIQALRKRCETLGIDLPKARRWPVRIILSELADSLARKESSSVLGYVAKLVSDRSSVAVDAADMRSWLSSYPWLVLVDGLDEVPNSSNRQDVMDALSEFSLEATAAGAADIAIVATTRPQGYSDDFNPEIYTHFNLTSLNLEKALEYAKGFIAVRLGANSPGADRTLERLTRASRDATTARLFSSPLQVSILSILVEKLGQVPRDRWRLFSQYYRVITQRELEKGGELSDLLQAYESDVDYLHRQIGDLLQQRSAEAGENSATISRDEFLDLIAARLRQQGHTEDQILTLSSEFSRLVTDRLVFLALINSKRVGFEIRSLQEFMAGEFVVSLPESKIIDAIRVRAVDPFWRNVVLFSIGCIFAEREHLKGGVVSLCAELDLLDDTSRLLRPGGVLALDVLLDGSCHSQPRYAKPLAERAAALIDGPVQHRIRDLAELTDGPASELIGGCVLSTATAPLNVWINRALAISELCAHDSSYQSHLDQLFLAAPESARGELVSLSLDMENPYLDSSAMRVLPGIDSGYWIPGRYGPGLLLAQRGRRGSNDEQNKPPALAAIRSLFGHGFLDDIEVGIFGSATTMLTMGLVSIESLTQEWQDVRSLGAPEGGSSILTALADFAVSPSKATLGDALDAVALLPPDRRQIAKSGSWVIAACAESAEAFEELEPGTGAIYLKGLAALAYAGKLGDVDDWTAAEKRWQELDSDAVNETLRRLPDVPSVSEEHLPVWPELSTTGLPLFGTVVTMERPTNAEHQNQLIDLLIGWLEGADPETRPATTSALLQLAGFVASMMLRYPVSEGDSELDLHQDNVVFLAEHGRWRLLLEHLADQSSRSLQHQLAWLDWVPEAHQRGVLLDDRTLCSMGSHSRIKFGADQVASDVSWMTASQPDWRRLRLRLHFDLAFVRGLNPADFELQVLQTEHRISQLAETTLALIRLVNGPAIEISKGSLDSEIRSLMMADNDSVNLEMLDRCLALFEPDDDTQLRTLSAIATRAIQVLCKQRPSAVHVFLSRLNRVTPRLWRNQLEA